MADDEHLIARVARGDATAFGALYRRHRDVVVAFLRRRVAEPELAFDLAAETWAEVVVAAPGFRAEGPVIGWILGIARHKLGDSLRRGRVEDAARRRLALEPLVLDDEDLARIDERAAAGGPELDAALAALPAPTREALVARVVQERSYAEIAAELGCSQQVVRQRVHRGLARMRAAMEGER